jgi:hypothetical protein
MIATIASTAVAGATTIITRLRRNANSKILAENERGSLAAPPFVFYFVVSEAR